MTSTSTLEFRDDLMRGRTWLIPVWSVLFLTLSNGRDLLAQAIPPPQGYGVAQQPWTPTGYAPAGVGYVSGGPPSPMGQLPNATVPRPHGVMPFGSGDMNQFPPSFAPWPSVSPYESGYTRHYNDQGQWFKETRNQQRRYSFRLEALISRTKKPESTIVGSPGIAPFDGAPFSHLDLGGLVEDNLGAPLVDTLAVLQQREQDPTSPGIRAVWEFVDADGTGFEVAGTWSSDTSWFVQRGLPGRESDLGSLRVTFGLPLDDGADGITVPYDEFYRIEFSTETFGTEVNRILNRRRDGGRFQIRPTWGLRYLFIRERFNFNGSDSGLAVSFLQDGTPDPATTPIPIVDSFTAELHSAVRTHLFGPQVGLRYEVGGDTLRISGATQFGILGNQEKLELSGNGIGDGFDGNFLQDSPFQRSEDHFHISPLLAQSINFDINGFGAIPILRNMPVLQNAKIRAGYSITGVWEVSRPGRGIVWAGQPLFPRIQVDRSKWYIQSWHFGIHWLF